MSTKTPIYEYKELSKRLDDNVLSKADIYTDLLKIEENVLKTINRVAESKLKDEIRGNTILDEPLPSLMAMTANNWLNMALELMQVKSFFDVKHILLDGNRKIFLGLFIACIGFFIFFVDISS